MLDENEFVSQYTLLSKVISYLCEILMSKCRRYVYIEERLQGEEKMNNSYREKDAESTHTRSRTRACLPTHQLLQEHQPTYKPTNSTDLTNLAPYTTTLHPYKL